MLQVHLNGKDTLLKEDCVTVDDLLADSPWNKEKILIEPERDGCPKRGVCQYPAGRG